MTESTANPLDTLLQQGRNAVSSAQYHTMEATGVLWGVCVLTAINGASFIGTASAATPSDYSAEWETELHDRAYSAAHAQLQAAENYCLRDKIAFLVKQGFVQAPVVAESTEKVAEEAAPVPKGSSDYAERCLEEAEQCKERAEVLEKQAVAEVAHLSARAAEELKAEVLAEDFLKQQELQPGKLDMEEGCFGWKK